jgi:hypothetical protein
VTLLIGIVIGIAAYWLFERTLMRFARSQFDPTHVKSIRKNLLDKMGYDALVAFEAAVRAELARRRSAEQ